MTGPVPFIDPCATLPALQKMGLAGKTNLRLCDEKTLMDTLGVTKGSVSYLATINDTEGQVKICLDKALLSAPKINGHPLRCDRTTSVAPDGEYPRPYPQPAQSV